MPFPNKIFSSPVKRIVRPLGVWVGMRGYNYILHITFFAAKRQPENLAKISDVETHGTRLNDIVGLVRLMMN
jgi:hypothetical protein